MAFVIPVGGPLDWTPPPSEDLSSPLPGLQIGTFCSTELHFYYSSKGVFHKIPYECPYPGPPGLVLALACLDLDFASPHLAASASDICSASFTANLLAREPYYTGSLSWLAIPPDSKDFLYGTVHEKGNAKNLPGTLVIRPVQFQRNFSSPPKVVVWLSEVELGKCVRVSAVDIRSCGFSVRFETNDPAKTVNDAMVSWVAYPGDMPGISSGTASTEAQRPTTKPQLYNTGYIRFPEGVFKKTPRVMAGLNYLDLGSKQNPRISVQCSNVSVFGMTWEANGWCDTVVSGAGISYLAFE
ncbi:hypothetical protein L873DRAFT_1741307 [Choiromyces venosus 120613-1]|uniref:H-type lectin domain-containing protein n=1 Tax=Choiromyces venosus 120613-1 TaxID=1336337 RepID=A0A3N4JHJ2_9PEZI|nr:hypothetical protein L873DRAFT_1741307 [Choiromyces venosus 120613-1]